MIIRRLPSWPTWEWRNPWEELERMRREMDRLSEDFLEGAFREPAAGVFPLLNVTEDKDKYYVRAELPGVSAEELDISATGNTLSISGERKTIGDEEKARFHRRERGEGRFSRVITLPGQVDPDKVDASCTNGILTVVLPKAEVAKPKQISVKGS